MTEDREVLSSKLELKKYRVKYQVTFYDVIDGRTYYKGLRGELVRMAYDQGEAEKAVKKFLETTQYFPYVVNGEMCLFNPPRPAEYIQVEESHRTVEAWARLYGDEPEILEGSCRILDSQ